VLVDLVNARGLVDPATSEGVDQVWLRAGAPASVEENLVAAGVRVQSRETRTETAAELRRQAVPRAAVLSLWIGGVALLLAVLALVAVRVADLARRRWDWSALRQAGLSTRTLRRLAFAEFAVPALIGTAIGVLAGQAAIRLAAARLPLVDPAAPGPPLDLRLEWLPAGGLGLAVAVLILVVAAVGASIEARTRSGR
jgi:predicted lysophospholipase L1 biosynthesis ABC-type transport system permease subunit